MSDFLCYDAGVPKLVHKTSVDRERVRVDKVSGRISAETRALLDALALHDPPISASRAIEEGIRLVARWYRVSGRRENSDPTTTRAAT